MNKISCRLPGGYVDKEGVVHRDAVLSSLTGHEEELLAGNGNGSIARLVTDVLGRCVHRVGTISPLTEGGARDLLVADRQYLLLKLREATFGETVRTTILCPWPECGQKVDVEFFLKDIPVEESSEKGPIHSLKFSTEAVFSDKTGHRCSDVDFRLPNGGDQEALSAIIVQNGALALTRLLERCITRLGPHENPGSDLVALISPVARMEIESRMASIAPKVNLNMGARCPECGREFNLPFELQDFFFGELRISQDLLYREIHYLAYHYHWSEQEIMQMPREKRRRYIEVLADEIERLNNAV